MSSGFPFSLAPPNRLRRSVVDPDTGQPVVTSAPTGEVRQRASLLPVGRDDSGALVPAVPQGLFDAIDAARFPGRVARGEAEVFDRATGHVSDEAIGAATGLAGLAMTGGLGGVAADGVALGAGPVRRLTYDSPLIGARRVSQAQAEREIADRTAQAGTLLADPERAPRAAIIQSEAEALGALLPKFGQESFPRGRPFEPRRLIDLDDGRAVRVQEDGDARTYRVFERQDDGALSRPRGQAELTLQPDGRWRTDMLKVQPAHQGKGLASSLYSAVERDTGQPRVPSGELLPDGYAFWQKRDPDAVQFHQQVEDRFFSPRRITEALASDMTPPERAAVLRQALDRVPPEGRTPEALARQHYLVPGSIAAAGATTLTLPDDARAAPSPAQEPSMSAGALPGFGLIPNAGPDDFRRLLRLMPLDPSQSAPIMDAGGLDNSENPRGLQGQMPRTASPSGPLLDMADLNGPAGAQIHHPGTVKPAGLQSAIAMDEADTQRLEQQTGMMPPAPASGGLLSELFGKAPMGAPQSFSGTSGTIVPSQDAGLQGSPMPPPRPSATDLAAPPQAARVPSFGSLRPPARPAQADMPAPGAVPTAGQAPQAVPAPAGVNPTAATPPGTAAPGGTTPGTPPTEEPSFLDKVGSGFQRFSENGGGDLLGSIGMGLMSTPGFGQGLAAGLKNYQGVSERRETRDLAKQEFGLRIQKAAQEATGLKGNQAFIKTAFPNLTPEQVVAGASNSTLVSAAIAKMQNPNAGREMRADSSGVNRWVDTGQPVFKDDEGKADWQQVSLPDGGTMLYSKSDPSKTQVVVQGQPARPATAEERAAYGIQPGQGVKITPKEGPVPVGGVAQPHVREFEQPDGSKIARVQNPETGAWEAPNFGAKPPATQAPSNPYATGKFNEGQGKAAGFSDRMMGSEQILRGLETVNQGAIRGTVEGMLPNAWKTEDRQKLEQAQRDFINAQLRRESGAAISPSEFSNAEKQYFPQPGDSDAVIAQKRTNRQRAVEAMGRESGPAYAPSKKFDEKGGIVPSMTPDSRFKQLRGAGLSKEDAYARMHTEGY